MQIFQIEIQGISPYSQSKHYELDKLQGEGQDDYYQRTWKNHLHTRNGEVFIPPNAFKNCLSEAAKYMNLSVPGKGKNTYTKHFEAGVQISRPIMLGIKAEDVKCEKLFLPSDGKRGGSKRVWKYYPYLEQWRGVIECLILDETCLQTSRTTGATILEDVCRGAGQYIGLGRFRPRNNGYYGRFDVLNIVESKMQKAA